MSTRELARRTIMVLAMLIVLASDIARSNPDTVFIHVHGPDGDQEIEVNTREISSIRQPRENADQHFAKGVSCLIYMTSGQFIATSESCAEIVKKITALDLPPDKK